VTVKTILVAILFFLLISAGSYYLFVETMARSYGESWEVMSKVVNEVLMASPLKTGLMIFVIGVLAYWATWFSFRPKRRK
jgi:hypothetical protein